MQITLKDGYVENWSVNGNIENSITVKEPDDFVSFLKYYFCYKFQDGKIEKDEKKIEEYIKKVHIEHLREQRKQDCFTIINRGKLWYSRLTDGQYNELKQWYEEWLNVTETLVIPVTPSWL